MRLKLSQLKQEIRHNLSEAPLGEFPPSDRLPKTWQKKDTQKAYRDTFSNAPETFDVFSLGRTLSETERAQMSRSTARKPNCVPVSIARNALPELPLQDNSISIVLISEEPGDWNVKNLHNPLWLAHDLGHMLEANHDRMLGDVWRRIQYTIADAIEREDMTLDDRLHRFMKVRYGVLPSDTIAEMFADVIVKGKVTLKDRASKEEKLADPVDTNVVTQLETTLTSLVKEGIAALVGRVLFMYA